MAALGGVGLVVGAWPAHAASASTHYEIAAKPLPEALIDLALQAHVSLLGVEACAGVQARPLKGRYSLEEALNRLLAGAPCAYRVVDARTVALGPARPAPVAGASRAPPGRAPVRGPEVAELVVHASKRDTPLSGLSAPASVMPRQRIEAIGASDVGGTTGQLAGLHMTNLGPGRDKLLVRGLSDGAFTGRARSTVATYLDDVPINYSAPHPDLRFVDIEQIEVVRGPQGSLYGAGALSGVYRIVTNKPDLTYAGGALAASSATTKGGSPSYAIDGWWNAPLVSDRLAVRVVAYHEQMGGYLDDVNMRRSNVDRTSRSGARLAVRAQLSDNFRADLSMTGQRLDTNDTQYTTPILGPARRANRVREAHDNDFFQTALTLEGEVGGMRLHSSTGYVRHNYASQYDASSALDLFSANGFDLGVYSEDARVDLLVQDISVSVANPTGLSWLLGAYGARSREGTPSELRVRRGAVVVPVYQEERRDQLREAALYGEATLALASGWSMSLGARAFDTWIDTEAQIELRAPAQGRAMSARSHTSGISPKLSVQYVFPSGDLVYALMSEGYRAAGVNSSGLTAPPPTRARYGADHLRNYEIGGKFKLLDGRLQVSGAAFYDLWTDIQTDRYLSSGLAYTTNAGDARIVGIEAELAYDWDFGLSLRANGALSASELTRASRDFGASLARRLPGVPELSGGVLALYHRPLTDGLELQLTGEASYVGPSRLSFDSKLSPPMGDYVRSRMAADLVAERWRAGVFVSNLADSAGDTFAYGNPFSFGQVRQATPQRPRTVGARLTVAF